MSTVIAAPSLSSALSAPTESAGTAQLVIDSEHRLRSENLAWDIDVWYPSVAALTFPSLFLPLTMQEARAILSFHDVSWRHAKAALLPEEIATLRALETAIDDLLGQFEGEKCAFMRLCGRSPKDGEPLDRSAVMGKYEAELAGLLREGLPLTGNTKMIAIARTSTLKVSSGKEALSLLLTSERIYSDMLDWVKYGEPEQICLRQWSDELTLEFEFRVFVCNDKITAISQYDHYTHFPSLEPLRDRIRVGIERIWAVSHQLIGSPSYVVDIGFFPSRPDDQAFIVIEYGPFLPCTGAALFSWTADRRAMMGETEALGSVPEFRLKAEADVHPQLDDLVEINWDMRWAREVVSCEHWLTPPASPAPHPTSLMTTLRHRFASMFTTQGSSLPHPPSVMQQQQQQQQEEEGAEEEGPAMVQIFVYGTLKRGFQWNSKYLSARVGGQFIGCARTALPVPLVVGACGVPYVLGDRLAGSSDPDPDAQVVRGELWAVSEWCLLNLDAYEGVSKGYYSRISIDVDVFVDVEEDAKKSSGSAMEITSPEVRATTAFIYVLNQSTEELRAQPRLPEYPLSLHRALYHAPLHIQIKQKNYYKGASTWGKTADCFDESAYKTT